MEHYARAVPCLGDGQEGAKQERPLGPTRVVFRSTCNMPTKSGLCFPNKRTYVYGRRSRRCKSTCPIPSITGPARVRVLKAWMLAGRFLPGVPWERRHRTQSASAGTAPLANTPAGRHPESAGRQNSNRAGFAGSAVPGDLVTAQPELGQSQNPYRPDPSPNCQYSPRLFAQNVCPTPPPKPSGGDGDVVVQRDDGESSVGAERSGPRIWTVLRNAAIQSSAVRDAIGRSRPLVSRPQAMFNARL